MSQYHPLNELFLSRMRLFVREPEAVFWVYVFPLLLMVGLGIAFSGSGSQEVWVRVCATSELEQTRLASALESQPGFVVTRAPLAEVDAVGVQTKWDLTVVGRDGTLEYRFDPARPESLLARAQVDQVLQRAAGRSDPVPSESKPFSAPGSRYIDWLIPGLIGLNIMGGGLWGVGFSTVDLRIRKLLKRFRATPMRRSDFLLSLMASRLVFLVPEVSVILLAGHLAFGFETRGHLLAMMLIALLGATAFSGIGLLVACRAQKLETISGLMNAVMLPMWILSGVFFGAERFPDVMQPFVQALPLTQLNNALRGVALAGHGLHQEWLALLILTVWGGLSFPLALRWFRWQ